MTRFKPTTRDLEMLCEHAAAKVPAHVTARVLGVEVEDLRELAARLAKGRAAMAAPESPLAADSATPLSLRDNRVFR